MPTAILGIAYLHNILSKPKSQVYRSRNFTRRTMVVVRRGFEARGDFKMDVGIKISLFFRSG